VVALTSGAYAPATITQSVAIESAPGVYAGITPMGSGAGVTVNGLTDSIVVLRGLTIYGGSADGIDFNTGAALHVENCVINGVGKYGLNDTGPGYLFVKDTVIRNCIPYWAVYLNNAGAHASLSHVRLENNTIGFYASNGTATISDSVISGNGGDGIILTGGGSEVVEVESCQIANSGGNGIEVDNGTVRVSNSTVTDNNDVGLDNAGGTFDSYGNNRVAGNSTPTSGAITTIGTM
jgi:hypothetical protein